MAAGAAGYAADLTAMKAAGASLIRWWVFPDFRGDGVTFDASDDPTGLSATALADVAKALELAQQADVYLVPTIFSFDAFRPKATMEGVTKVTLAVTVGNAAAITLYESIGFKVYGREHCALIVDGVPYDDVLMDIQL